MVPQLSLITVQIKYFNYDMYNRVCLGMIHLAVCPRGIREKFHFGGSPVAFKDVKIVILRDDDWITRGWVFTRILKAPRKLYVDNSMLRLEPVVFLKLCLDGPKTWHAKKIVPQKKPQGPHWS